MSLDLDERQRAMLAEMGVRLFQRPTVAPEAIPASARAVPVPAAPSVVPVRQVAPAAVPVTAAPLAAIVRERPAGTATMDWPALRDAVAGCQACKLCSSRRNPVFGVGDERADWLIVGEPPDEDEDLQGEPFVGQAGKLLDNMLKALQLDRRHKVFVTNVLKCRPPGNRNPEPEEMAQCEPYLRRQVELLQPKIILAMGRFAVQSLLQTAEPLGRLRGKVHQYQGVPVVVTYHPAKLLHNQADKGKAWADLCLAMHQVQSSPD